MIVNMIIWLLFGGLVGYMAALVMGAGDNMVTNIVMGIIGAFLSILMVSSSNTLNILNIPGLNDLSVAIIGAAVFTLVFQVFKQPQLKEL